MERKAKKEDTRTKSYEFYIMVRYKDVGDDWISPVYKNYTLICCSCGLTHKLDFRIKNGKIQFRVRRNEYSTANVRRKMGKLPNRRKYEK